MTPISLRQDPPSQGCVQRADPTYVKVTEGSASSVLKVAARRVSHRDLNHVAAESA